MGMAEPCGAMICIMILAIHKILESESMTIRANRSLHRIIRSKSADPIKMRERENRTFIARIAITNSAAPGTIYEYQFHCDGIKKCQIPNAIVAKLANETKAIMILFLRLFSIKYPSWYHSIHDESNK